MNKFFSFFLFFLFLGITDSYSQEEVEKTVRAQTYDECITDSFNGEKNEAAISFDYEMPQQYLDFTPRMSDEVLSCVGKQLKSYVDGEAALYKGVNINQKTCTSAYNEITKKINGKNGDNVSCRSTFRKLCTQYVKCADESIRFTVCDCKFKNAGDALGCLKDNSMARLGTKGNAKDIDYKVKTKKVDKTFQAPVEAN